jgi:hypothetical protein
MPGAALTMQTSSSIAIQGQSFPEYHLAKCILALYSLVYKPRFFHRRLAMASLFPVISLNHADYAFGANGDLRNTEGVYFGVAEV